MEVDDRDQYWEKKKTYLKQASRLEEAEEEGKEHKFNTSVKNARNETRMKTTNKVQKQEV